MPERTATFREVFAVGEFRVLWIAQVQSRIVDQFARVALRWGIGPHRPETELAGQTDTRAGLVIAATQDENAAPSPSPTPPWPLTCAEINAFATDGLTTHRIERLLGPCWRAEFHRPR